MLRTLCQTSVRSNLLYGRYAITQQRTGIFDALGDALNKSGGMDKLQQIVKLDFEGTSDDGLVHCVVKGDDSIGSISIKPELMKKDVHVVENSVKEAVNDGLKRVSVLIYFFSFECN